jgi:hypothetical protein
MNCWAIQSILSMAKKTVLLYTAIVIISSCTFKRINKSMDISEIVGKQEDLEDFIHHYFDSVEYDRVFSPILFFNVNFISKTDHLTFCKMNIQQCWVKKTNDLYAFFMVIKTSAEIEKNISLRYGKWDTKGSVSIQDVPLGGDLFTWNIGHISIDVSSYENMLRIPKYEACELVVCGNMTYRQLLDLPEK